VPAGSNDVLSLRGMPSARDQIFRRGLDSERSAMRVLHSVVHGCGRTNEVCANEEKWTEEGSSSLKMEASNESSVSGRTWTPHPDRPQGRGPGDGRRTISRRKFQI
jgi:hypothetical protein